MSKQKELLKKAIFGMRRNAMNRENQAFQNQMLQHLMKQRESMTSQGMSPNQAMEQLRADQQTRFNQQDQQRAEFDQRMAAEQQQRSNPLYSANPQTRNAILRAQTDQKLLQEKVDAQKLEAENIGKERALAQQYRNQGNTAWANRLEGKGAMPSANQTSQILARQNGPQATQGGQHVVDASGAVRYTPNAYEQAKADLVKMNPNLGMAGHEDNTRFINSLKSTYGDNYREQMQQNPALLSQAYNAAFPNQNVASAQNQPPGQPVKANTTAPLNANPTNQNAASVQNQPLGQNVASTQNQPLGQTPGQPVKANTTAPAFPSRQTSTGNFSMSSGNPIISTGTPISTGTETVKQSSMQINENDSSIINIPKTAKDLLISAEIENEQVQNTFRKTAEALGLSDFGIEEALHDMLQEKAASTSESRFMNHLRRQLFKEAKLLGDACPYSAKELTEITKSAEAFQKAAMLEAKAFWVGLADSLLKQGKDEDFLKGILKQAQDFSEIVGAEPSLGDMGKGMLDTVREGAGKAFQQLREKTPNLKEIIDKGSTDADTALKQIGESAAAGASGLGDAASSLGVLAKETGSEIANTATDTAGKIKEQAAPFMQEVGTKTRQIVDKGKDVIKNLTSSLTPEDDRHQIIPGIGNQYMGAAGGALLSALLGSQLGLSGPASWLIPLLGGAAGYHYLPKLMNMWKDAPGTGVNKIPQATQRLNQQYPILGSPAPFVGNPPPFTGPSSPMRGAGMSPGTLVGLATPKTV